VSCIKRFQENVVPGSSKVLFIRYPSTRTINNTDSKEKYLLKRWWR